MLHSVCFPSALRVLAIMIPLWMSMTEHQASRVLLPCRIIQVIARACALQKECSEAKLVYRRVAAALAPCRCLAVHLGLNCAGLQCHVRALISNPLGIDRASAQPSPPASMLLSAPAFPSPQILWLPPHRRFQGGLQMDCAPYPGAFELRARACTSASGCTRVRTGALKARAAWAFVSPVSATSHTSTGLTWATSFGRR